MKARGLDGASIYEFDFADVCIGRPEDDPERVHITMGTCVLDLTTQEAYQMAMQLMKIQPRSRRPIF
jgi:hypothetical protein